MKEKITKNIKRQGKHNKVDAIIAGTILLIIPLLVFVQQIKDVNADRSHSEDAVITMTGDVMLSRYVTKDYMKKGNEYYFEHVDDVFSTSDLVLTNFESAVVNDLTQDYRVDPRSQINLAVDKEAIEKINESKINLLSLANNHIGDYGYKGLLETLEITKELDVSTVGLYENAKQDRLYYYEEIDGNKIAIVSASDVLNVKEYKPTLKDNHAGFISSWTQEDLLMDVIQEAKEEADVVIAYIHWGNEYISKISERQIDLSKRIVDAGADMIVGHHPHVLQEISQYKGVPIINSLGNFVFDQVQGDTSLSSLLSVHIEEGTIQKLYIRPLVIENSRPTKAKNKLQRNRIKTRLLKNISDDYVTEDEYGDYIVSMEWLND